MTSICPTCGDEFVIRRPRQGQTFCSWTCWKRERGMAYEDVADLIRLGETPQRAAQRCGVTIDAAEKWFRRHGWIDEARLFARARKSGAYA